MGTPPVPRGQREVLLSSSAALGRSRQSLPRQTLVEAAYRAVRAAIVDGRFPPGRKLVVRALAEELGLSQTPLKAALAALEREGFVIAITDRGYFVPRIDGEDLRQIYELREVVDGIAARNAAHSDGRLELVGVLRDLLAQQHRCVELGDLRRYSDLDVLFHSAIWQACGNPRLTQIAENLLGQLRIGSGTTAQIPGRLRGALREHASILDAIEQSDSAAAEKHTRTHVRRARNVLEKVLASPAQ